MHEKPKLTSDLEEAREENMENRADDLMFNIHGESSPKSWGVWAVLILAGLMIPFFYLAISLFSGLSSTTTGFVLLIASMVIGVGAMLGALYAIIRSHQTGGVMSGKSGTRNSYLETQIKDLMTADPILCGSLDEVQECAKIMYQNNVGYLIVIDGNDRCVGVVTDRDLVCGCLAQGLDPVSTPVTEVMERNFKSVRSTDTTRAALRLMSDEGIRRVPVIDGGRCVGVISVDDFIRKQACRLDDLAPIFRAQLAEPNPQHDLKTQRDYAA